MAALEEEIQSLKQAVCQIPSPVKGFYSNMFIVDGGQRPAINLKYLNKHVKSEHFKMEGLHTVSSSDLCQGEVWHLNSPATQQLPTSTGGGGDSITKVVPASKEPVALVYGEEHSSSGSAPARSSEYDCRRGVQNLVRQIGMETFSCPIQENQSSFGTIVHRPVCKQTIFTVSTVCELEARSPYSSHRWIGTLFQRSCIPIPHGV